MAAIQASDVFGFIVMPELKTFQIDEAEWDAAEAYWDAIDQRQWEEDLQGDKEYKNYLEQQDYYHCRGYY
ncbi:hypothetical protein [Synechococcus sp. PCC 6312]|uniref:hypothetical protein n=1 Tax=Synechococcus sp. (strain ATCC 27167 / PCC 6312) TaxID=195253 RepID=UPI00029ECA20|nr:hypothetical protein [Synechococcus sp. PCC 6312]AFY61937.1 hypothetical protein Syn6312_2873 [Synechococcus sp. PCC 6312]